MSSSESVSPSEYWKMVLRMFVAQHSFTVFEWTSTSNERWICGHQHLVDHMFREARREYSINMYNICIYEWDRKNTQTDFKDETI